MYPGFLSGSKVLLCVCGGGGVCLSGRGNLGNELGTLTQFYERFTPMDHFEEGPERQAFYRNVHRPLKMWFSGKGEAFAKLYGPFPTFWQVRGWPWVSSRRFGGTLTCAFRCAGHERLGASEGYVQDVLD